MSINIIVGSDEEDIVKIKNTISTISLVKNMVNEYATIKLSDLSLSQEDLDSLIDWYASMLDILTNPSFATESV
jgi:methionine salvage enolase-phosphatase E1